VADDTELLRSVGRRIREARAAAGLSQQQVASRVGMTRSSVANLEAGRQDMNITRLTAVLAALGIGLDALILPGDLPELPPLPPKPHDVVTKPVLEVSCTTCGGRVLDVTNSREAARRTRDDHIAEMLEKDRETSGA
jgi:transcriptional regulator with XRE-family HTH domain